MAVSGSSHLKDIDEKFCQCPICLQQYRQPKQLPCLHRYCRNCLKQLLERDQGATVITCPECRDEFSIPKEGVEGFKTDFYMKNIIEYIQIQKSLEPEQLRECFDCSKELKVTSYCFKCNGFLCKGCHDNHMTKRSLKDHKQHTLSVDDMESKAMTLEKLADLQEAPRCEIHLKDMCLLCCRTCNDHPICVTCTYGTHKNHDINDVGIIAADERENLITKLNNLNQYREQMLTFPQTLDRVKAEFLSNVKEKKEKLTIRYEGDTQTVREEIEKIEKNYKLSQTEIESNKERELVETSKQMDEEMRQVKIKYDNICGEIREACRVNLDNHRKKKEEELQKNKEKIAILEREFQTSVRKFEKKREERLLKLQGISEQFDGIKERYDNLTKTAYSLLEIRNDWTAVQCIPDICKAIEPLSGDMKEGFPKLETLSRIRVSCEITEDEKSPVDIKKSVRNIDGITKSGDGSFIITGCASADYESHITVINVEGQVLRQTNIKGTRSASHCFCTTLSQFKVAAVSQFNEIAVFDVRDGSYIKKNIGDVTNKRWPPNRWIVCIATDANFNILVGGLNSRDVYVFDDQLNYLYILTLPEIIKYPWDMIFSEGYLLVCDRDGMRAYVVNIVGLGGEVIHEFSKPSPDPDDWRPFRVCTDKNGFIYIMWMTGTDESKGRRVLLLYSEEDRHLLSTKQLDVNDANCITTVDTGVEEDLLIATYTSRKLYIYNIR